MRRTELARIPFTVEEDVVAIVRPLLESGENHCLPLRVLRLLAPDDCIAPAGAVVLILEDTVSILPSRGVA